MQNYNFTSSIIHSFILGVKHELNMHDNRMLRGLLEPMRQEVTRGGRSLIVF